MNDNYDLNLYNFVLPKELIAQEPVSVRGESRLMVYYRQYDKVEHLMFKDIVRIIDKDCCVVLNKTKVFPTKLYCKKPTGGNVTIIVTKIEEGLLKCIFSPYKKISIGQNIILPNGLTVSVVSKETDTGEFVLQGEFTKEMLSEVLHRYGVAPLPPYIKRSKEDPRHSIDLERYQTVYAQEGYSIAAPTAGLHFSKEIIDELMKNNVKIVYITLNIGIGTFKPISTPKINKHKMLPEYGIIDKTTAEVINDYLIANKKIFCVGTTTVRILEFVYNKYKKIVPYEGWVDNFIFPPYKFNVPSGLVTNFHLPKSTNLVLVSAFVGREKLLQLYSIAIKQKYRFYSYGDAMMIV